MEEVPAQSSQVSSCSSSVLGWLKRKPQSVDDQYP